MMKKLYLIFLVLTLAGCGAEEPTAVLPTLIVPSTAPAATKTPNIAPTWTAAPPTAVSSSVWSVQVDPAVDEAIAPQIEAVVAAHPDRFTLVNDGEADMTITLEGQRPLTSILYAVAAPFPTIPDDIALAELQTGSAEWGLLLTNETAVALAPQLGGSPATIVERTALVEQAWAERPSRIILPFDQLTPELKVLTLDGQSPLEKGFNPANYPLRATVGVSGDSDAIEQFLQFWDAPPIANYDPDRLTSVAMSGVLALVRATAYQMELNGVGYPAEEVAPVMLAADIAHVSNEVAFAPDCPYPNPVGGTTFCSHDRYFSVLTDVGADVVELTGNHVNDWGTDNFLHSLQLYDEAGMVYFGGGSDLAEAQQAATMEHNGNKIAFLGCNPVGPNFAWATAVSAGSRPCDEGFYEQIAQLAADGYQVIATLQYHEFYHYAATPQQRLDFQRLAEAGATAVSGSQGHHAQGFEFHNGAFIHYGLGNLFFDQMDMLGTRQTFVDTYTFYDNRLISVQLWTGLIENWSRPRLTTPQERWDLLTAVFQASGW